MGHSVIGIVSITLGYFITKKGRSGCVTDKYIKLILCLETPWFKIIPIWFYFCDK